jgi:serine/threonine protein kinase
VVDGMQAGVGAEGIVRLKKGDLAVGTTTRKLPMRDRLVVLCKLGHGASSAVYKALDLTDMRLVALKMIHVNDRDKREQFVRELRSLFSMLRENSRRSSIHMPKKNRRPEKYIVDFYDAFR